MDTASNGVVSPLKMTFDFELETTTSPLPPSPFPPAPLDDGRRGTSDGKGRGYDGHEQGGARGRDGPGGQYEGLDTPADTAGMDDFARAVELSLSRPTTSGSDIRQTGAVEFHPSLFPHKAPVEKSPAVSPPASSPMSRSFVDSRDKPYGPSPTPRPPPLLMLANNSSPNLSSPGSSGSGLRAPASLYHARLSPKISMQDQFPRTDYSGSTARPSTRASSGSPTVTIGTPYQATSSTFPLPQHVQTRPKNDNTEAMVSGVKVPTHHTSAPPKLLSKTVIKTVSKPAESKRKTRLLNPLALLQRRRSEHPTDNAEEERAQRQAQAQALARQRDVVASGVNRPPPNFDPRIKGKKVHDFSAPRGQRSTFDEMNTPLPPREVPNPASPAEQSPMSPMSANGFPPRTASLVNRGPHRELVERPEKRSTHTPVFVEHLSENPEAERRVSSIHAENLENKDFLQRASKQSATTSHSQESTILPPFARRSQILDPLQASLYQDDHSKRSSDPSTTDKDQDTSFSSLGDISPITARSSAQNFGPISPASLGEISRPVSHVSYPPSSEQTTRLSPLLSKTPLRSNSRRTTSEAAAYNQFDNPPTQPAVRHFPAQEPHVDTPIGHSGLASQSPARDASSPTTDYDLAKTLTSQTPGRPHDSRSHGASRKLVEKRASAVGHAKRSPSTPKKHASNASRFSFQLGESAAQEHALEEKHRKIVSTGGPAPPLPRAFSPDEDGDDFFDEDAMDDMDEMEIQGGRINDGVPAVPQSSLHLHKARQALRVPESDDSSMYEKDIPDVTDERDVPYADHPSFRAHPAMNHHFAQNSMLPGGSEDYYNDGYWRDSTLDSYMRDSYYSSQNSQHSRMESRGSRITVDTGSSLHQGPGPPSFQDYLSVNDGIHASNRLSMPRPNLLASATSSPTKRVRPPLPARDSGNSERNRVASGMNFNSNVPTPSSEEFQWVGVDVQGSDHHVRDMSFSTASETQSSSGMSHRQSQEAEKTSHNQSQTTIAYPDVALTPRPGNIEFNDVDRSQIQGHVVSPQLNQQTLANLESGRSKAPSLASPKSAQSFHSDGRRNGSFGGLSLASPQSVFSHKSAVSGTFEMFAESTGMSRVGSPQAGQNALRPASNDDEQRYNSARQEHDAGDPGSRNGLGLGMFSGFDFEPLQSISTNTANDNRAANTENNTAEPVESLGHKGQFSLFSHQVNNVRRPGSNELQKDTGPVHLTMLQSNRTTESHYSELCETSRSTAVPGSLANYSPVRSSAIAGFQFSRASEIYDDSKDDMYFDDGNFEHDINAPHHTAFDENTFDENTFDDDAFLARPGMNTGNTGHVRDASSGAFSAASLGSLGPYPIFAIPNAIKARQRESQLMLEDLVLQDPVDPKLIPQRNPSEDAKRAGMSDKAPPLPIESSPSKEEAMHMQRSLDNYHAALANAANKAAADGRFWRAPSAASERGSKVMSKVEDGKSTYSRDEKSDLSNAEVDDVIALPDATALKSPPRPSGMSFDFGFEDSAREDVNDYDFDDDEDLVAAANAEALASDDEGFYGQEFAFYGRPRANSNEFNPTIGGYFGEDGDDGLQRNKSLREPNLTPITERSEFSTRNSVVGLGVGIGGQALYGPPSAGLYGAHSPALARMSVTPLMESEMSFDELRRLRGQAFGGSGKSLKSNSTRSSAQSMDGLLVPGQSGRPGSTNSQLQYGTVPGNSYNLPPSTDSNDVFGQAFEESPQSATSSQGNPFSMDLDLTPRKNSHPTLEPTTAREVPREESKVNPSVGKISHSRNGSGADSVTYVREPDLDNSGKLRWVMERRRTSEQGQLQLIGRELVQGGWI